MCGIAAIIAPGPSIEPGFYLSCLEKMTLAASHRGPDSAGFVIIDAPSKTAIPAFNAQTKLEASNSRFAYSPQAPCAELLSTRANIFLGHRRLSILDLSSAGHQPMCSEDKMIWITFNGEIYNFKEIRDELKQVGRKFQTDSDTEVLIAAYETWGEECLSRFNGMWALVLIDLKKNRLFAARDRFGVKPLYYFISSAGELSFSSEIKQLRFAPGWDSHINKSRAFDFLAFGRTDHTDETLFSRVKQIPGGHSLSISLFSSPLQNLPVKAWYKIENRNESKSFHLAAEEFENLLSSSINLRLRADVPVGSCLSGGLDSSLIVSMANRHLRSIGRSDLQHTITSCFEEKKFDERQYVEILQAKLQLNTHYVFPSPTEAREQLGKLAFTQDEPFASTSMYAQWKVFEEARRLGLLVMLDGQGADEQLAGYPRYAETALRESILNFQYGTATGVLSALGTNLQSKLKAAARTFFPSQWLQQKRIERLAWVSDSLMKSRDENVLRRIQRKPDSLREHTLKDLFETSLPMLLRYEDRNSMAHGVEARLPYLDYRLFEFVLSQPIEFKIRNGLTKAMLRKSGEEYLPSEIKNRRDKMGFVTPEVSWFRNTQRDSFQKLFHSALENTEDELNASEARKRFQSMLDGHIPFDFVPWRIISYSNWKSAFFET